MLTNELTREGGAGTAPPTIWSGDMVSNNDAETTQYTRKLEENIKELNRKIVDLEIEITYLKRELHARDPWYYHPAPDGWPQLTERYGKET